MIFKLLYLGERMVVWENLGMKPSADQFAELGMLVKSYWFVIKA